MFSPFETLEVQEWFRRFETALRRLPMDERLRQREEVQQHLEGLAAAQEALGQTPEAAWKMALVQFGDPTQIGRKLCQEWQQGRTGFRADIRAIGFSLGLLLLVDGLLTMLPLNLLWSDLHFSNTSVGFIARWMGSSTVVCFCIGRKYPYRAIKTSFYSLSFCMMIQSLLHMHMLLIIIPKLPTMIIVQFFALMPVRVLVYTAVAYLVSVTKRGWYRPSLADFKLTPPRTRLKISR